MALLLCGCNENAAVHSLCSLCACTPSFNERSECPEEGWPGRAGEESLHRERHRKGREEHWASSATPSFNERSECPEEGWPCRAGEESLHRERHRKVGEEHRGRDAPAPRAERIAAKSA